MKRPGKDEMKELVDWLYETTDGWDEDTAAVVAMFDGVLATKMNALFEAGRDVRKYLEGRGR